MSGKTREEPIELPGAVAAHHDDWLSRITEHLTDRGIIRGDEVVMSIRLDYEVDELVKVLDFETERVDSPYDV